MRPCAMLLLIAAGCAAGDNLPSEKDFVVSGDARFRSRSVRLTPAEDNQTGAVWLASKQHIAGGFDTRFTFQFTDQGGLGDGADGLAFVIQNSGLREVGAFGGYGGFGDARGDDGGRRRGIAYSLAVFFDSFHNHEFRDPSDNALHIYLNGKPRELRWPPARFAVVPRLRSQLKDGREHTARVQYRPPVLTVHLDDELLVQTPVDLSLVMDREGKAWVGFTASTGGGYENHDLLAWDWNPSAESSITMVESTISFVLKECLPGRNLCTPEDSVVEEKEPGLFRVILPAHLEWGVGIPNPQGRAVEILDATGHVCWDASLGTDGCGGPARALVSRNASGRTEFSVRDEGRKYSDNQGYLEFNVRLK